MQPLTPEQAVARLVGAIAQFDPEDLCEVYNTLFPEKRVSPEEAPSEVARLRKAIDDYIAQGLGIDEIMELWWVVFPGEFPSFYNEVTGMIEFEDETEPFSYQD